MQVFEFIVIIVALSIAGRVLQSYFAAKGAERGRDNNPGTLRAQEEVRALKERIQVLERVITDNHGSQDLDRQIERLRDR